MRLTEYECDPKQLSPLTLAFIGDGVYDLFVREEIVCQANRPVKESVSDVRHRRNCSKK